MPNKIAFRSTVAAASRDKVRPRARKPYATAGVSFLLAPFLGLAFIAVTLPSDVQAAGSRNSAARAAVTRKCSVVGFKSAKEYNSSTFPWYTYSTCMVAHGQKP